MKVFPPFRLDVADHCLWRDDQRVPLTPKAYAVLQYLVERAGRLVTQNELLEALWPDTFVQPEVLKSQILDVRNALGDRPKDPRFIETVPRKGYRFIAAVRDLNRETESPELAKSSLVGRDTALAELRACLAKAIAAERQIVFVTGEQGIGKTAVLEAFVKELEQTGGGMQIARGQCLEGFGGVREPYYPILEALGQLSGGAGADRLTQVLETHAPTWLIQLPALLRPEHREKLHRELLGATRERMIREIGEALERLAEAQPLVLIFEDLQWSDHSTIEMIAAAAHRRGSARLMLIGTYRPVDLVLNQHPLKQVSHSLKAYRLSREILLPPLDDHEVSAILGPDATPALASWIRKQTEGNPLFVLALIEHLRLVGQLAVPADHTDITVPETLRQLMELQIERLSPRDQLALDAAAVQGNTFSTSIIASALEVDAESIEDTCQDLARKNYILRPAPVEVLKDGSHSQRYEFLYPVIRGVFYQRLSAARRAKLHRRVAEAIESLRTGSPAEFAGELAGHFERSSTWSKSVEYLELSARKAMRRFEYKDAMHTLQRALRAAANLADPERVRNEMQILDHLAILQLALHELPQVVPTLELLRQKGEDSGSRDVAARALLGLAVVKSGQNSRLCPAILEEVDRLILTIENPGAQYYFRTQLGVSRILMLGWDAALAGQLTEDVELIRRSGPPHLVASLCMDQAYVLWASARYDESLRNAWQSLPVLLESGRLFRYLQGRDLVATNYCFLGEWGKALDILDEGIEQARKNEAPMRLAMPLVLKAWVHLQAGDYRGVLEMCEQALEVLQGPYQEDRRRIAQQFALAARLRSGDRKAALTGLLELCAKTADNPVMLSWYWRMPMQMDLAEAWLLDGNPDAARAECDRMIELSQQTSDRNFQALAFEASARIAVTRSDGVRAEEDIRSALERVDGFDVPLAAWRVHRTAAEVLSSDDHRLRSRQVIDRLSASIASRPELQRTFLASTAT